MLHFFSLKLPIVFDKKWPFLLLYLLFRRVEVRFRPLQRINSRRCRNHCWIEFNLNQAYLIGDCVDKFFWRNCVGGPSSTRWTTSTAGSAWGWTPSPGTTTRQTSSSSTCTGIRFSPKENICNQIKSNIFGLFCSLILSKIMIIMWGYVYSTYTKKYLCIK